MSRAPVLALLTALAFAAPAAAANTIVPDTFDDQLPADCSPNHTPGTCSLRAAVAAAQDGDTIQLAAGTYALKAGELLVTHDVTIIGGGPDQTAIQQQKAGERVLETDTGTSVSITGAILTGGNLVGDDGVNATPVLAATPGGSAYGGAINVKGAALTLTLVSIVGNSVQGGRGGNGLTPASGAGGPGKNGGYASGSAIEAPGHLTLDRVTIENNIAHAGNGGAGGNATGANDGGAGGDGSDGGGAISGGGNMVLLVTASTIANNKGFAGDGGRGGNGGSSAGADGGDGGDSIRGTGGAIFTNGELSIVNSTITGNEIHGGDGGNGGNGFSSGGDGGYAQPGNGGGVSLFNPPSPGTHGHIASSTIVANKAFVATSGSGGTGLVAGAHGPVYPSEGGNLEVYSDAMEIRDTVIAGGVASAPGLTNCAYGSSTVTSLGHNLEDKDQCIPTPAEGDQHGVDPKLGPLQDNVGPTETMAPLSGSPLIDAGPPTCMGLGAALATDQRGVRRGTPCDIGAYEAVPPRAGMLPAVAGSPGIGLTVSCTDGAFGGDQPMTIDTVWLLDGQQVGTGSDFAIPAADAGHALVCRQTATNAYGSVGADSAAVRVTAPPPASRPVVLSKLRVRKGKVTFRLSAPARVRFSLCRVKGKKCARVTKRAPKTMRGRKGANHTKLKIKGLRAGRYRLTATPAGGRAKHAAFRIKRR